MGHEDLELMTRAVEEAARCVSEPGKMSPKVGAVLAVGNELIDTAYRGEQGPGEHAEYTLLVKKQPEFDLKRATIYTTLEPCTERNPPKVPCATRLLGRGVSEVVIGMLDPDSRVYGHGYGLIKRAGIKVLFVPLNLRERLMEMNVEICWKYKANTAIAGMATFDPTKNNKCYKIGQDDWLFDTQWSQCGDTSMYVYSDAIGPESVGLAISCDEFEEVTDASVFDRSSRVFKLSVGQVAVIKNTQGRFALVKLLDVKNKSRGGVRDEIKIAYQILPDGTSDFSRPPA